MGCVLIHILCSFVNGGSFGQEPSRLNEGLVFSVAGVLGMTGFLASLPLYTLAVDSHRSPQNMGRL